MVFIPKLGAKMPEMIQPPSFHRFLATVFREKYFSGLGLCRMVKRLFFCVVFPTNTASTAVHFALNSTRALPAAGELSPR
jgi:hypothetical protein